MNWDVVKRLVAYGREQEKVHNKRFRFTLTTNGMLIDDDVIDFANREMHNVVLSLDGRKEVHDRLRRTAGDKGSYDIIVPKFQKLVEARGGKGYYVRGTLHPTTTWISPRTSSTWRTWTLRSCPWSRWSAPPVSPTP